MVNSLAQLLRAHEAKPTDVQTLIFSKKKFTSEKAKAWAKSHGYKSGDVDTTGDSHRLRQREPGGMKGFHTIELTDGVKAVIGKAKESAAPEHSNVRILESARLLEAMPDGPNGEKIFKVCLITEGLGNRRNMNYYGPEAIESAAVVYEGKSCYINHQSLDGEVNLPERDVRDKAGYWKNLSISEVDGRKGCIGELHCDLSESGRFLAEKVQSALNYKKSFPDNGIEYCGFSVNGDGDAERREVEVDGEKQDVNYVLAFTEESESCDLVTTPARGGKALSAIRESKPQEENVNKKIKKLLEAALTKLTESAKKATGDSKKPLQEGMKSLSEAVKAVEAEGEGEEMNEADQMDAILARREGEAEEDHVARMQAIKKAVDGMLQAEQAEPPQPEEAEEPGAEEKPPKPMESNRKLTADDLERNLLAVKSLVKESELPEDCYTDKRYNELARMPFAKAKAAIESDAKLAASILREADLPVASLRSGTRETGDRKSAFVESFKEAN